MRTIQESIRLAAYLCVRMADGIQCGEAHYGLLGLPSTWASSTLRTTYTNIPTVAYLCIPMAGGTEGGEIHSELLRTP